MMCYNFSLDEIREQLAVLGYHDVPHSKLEEFKRDLDQMTMLEDEELDAAPFPRPRPAPRHTRPPPRVTLPAFRDEDAPTAWRSRRDDDDDDEEDHEDDDEEEEEEEEEDITFVSSTLTPSAGPASARRAVRLCEPLVVTPKRTIRRKVVRREGVSNRRHVDESSYTEDVSVVSDEDSLAPSSLALGPHLGRPRGPPSARSLSARSAASESSAPGCPGLIMAGAGHPHTRNLRRADPVSRYHAYRQLWNSQSAPGERNHRQLRWAVKEAMMVHEVPARRGSRPAQVNKYVPPTDKQRKNLRWQIRQDMAQFNVPSKPNVARFF